MRNTGKLGIALGGGGSRAFIHLGVLRRLEEEGLRPDCVSGASMGAVLGALYAADPCLDTIVRALDYFRKSSLFGALIRQNRGDGLHRRPGRFGRLARRMATASVAVTASFRRGLRGRNPVDHAIDHFFGRPAADFSDLALPFGTNALDLTSGGLEEFTSGPVAPPLKAGVAVGLILPPHEWGGRQYADAAPLCPVPAGLCRRLGADVVLAVDICAPLERPLECDSAFDVVRRILSIQSEALNGLETGRADMVLKLDASDVFWADFGRIDELAGRGYEAAGGIVGELRERLAERRLHSA